MTRAIYSLLLPLLALAVLAAAPFDAWAGQFEHIRYYSVGRGLKPQGVATARLTNGGNTDLVLGTFSATR